MSKNYRSIPVSYKRKAIIASTSITKQKNTIHSIAEVDITEPRRKIKEHFEKTGKKLSLTSYIITCLAQVINQHPQLNSYIRGRKIILLDDVTISVLIEREFQGEKIPEPIAIKQAQFKTFSQIQDEIRKNQDCDGKESGIISKLGWIKYIPISILKTLVKIADKNIKMAKRYGKVAVTAVGMYSKEPVWFIPHGTATVLITVGSISNKVVEYDGSFVAREHLCITASFDHNLIDGAPAARFMNQFIETLKSGEFIQM